MRRYHLQIEHLDKKLRAFAAAAAIIVPERGWLHSIRTSIRMSQAQLGTHLGISKQAVKSLEDREASGSVTLKTLSEAADALDMKLVYGFVPRKGSLAAMIEARSHEVAATIVELTSTSMGLEDQRVSSERIKAAIAERAEQIAAELPRFIWD